MITRRTALALLASAALPIRAFAGTTEPAMFKDQIAAGTLPDMAGRLPKNPRVINLAAMGRQPGKYGGDIRMLIGGQRDIRLIPINGYARLVGYDGDLVLHPDILESYDVEDGRIFTFHLREGHRWSDGAPFTAEDFRYVWEDVLMNTDLNPDGPSVDMRSNGQIATFEVIDALTVRYTFASPAPDFLPRLAAPVPLILALPSHYMQQFHAKYQDAAKMPELIAAQDVDDWQGLHTKMSKQNRPENPDLPSLEAWHARTAPPAEQFVFERNPYFHRVDELGNQLPYTDRIVMNVASSEIITAKTATGESDLQITAISFPDFTLLKDAENNYPLKVSLWTNTRGSAVTLLPNLNFNDEVWRKVMQDARFRRGLSLAINRAEINTVIFFDLGRPSADTVLPESALYKPEYGEAYIEHDAGQASALLDAAGLDKRDADGTRLLPDGRRAEIIVESAGESTLEVDVLELITDHFAKVGIKMFIRTSQRDVCRSRALGGEVMMSVWTGLDNGIPTADMSPDALAPTSDAQLAWPIWGTYYLTSHESGSAPDLPEAAELVRLMEEWRQTTTTEAREAIWHKMLAIHADQVFSIGTVNGVLQPIVRSSHLQNVPEKALYGFQPTSYLGAYLPDTFWYDNEA